MPRKYLSTERAGAVQTLFNHVPLPSSSLTSFARHTRKFARPTIGETLPKNFAVPFDLLPVGLWLRLIRPLRLLFFFERIPRGGGSSTRKIGWQRKLRVKKEKKERRRGWEVNRSPGRLAEFANMCCLPRFSGSSCKLRYSLCNAHSRTLAASGTHGRFVVEITRGAVVDVHNHSWRCNRRRLVDALVCHVWVAILFEKWDASEDAWRGKATESDVFNDDLII